MGLPVRRALVRVPVCGDDPADMPPHDASSEAWDRPPRPSVLSDPYYEHGEERCRGFLAMNDADLTWHHFAQFFGPVPAGTFDEVAYFLPLAFRHMQAKRDGYGENLAGFVYWLSDSQDDLARVGATAMVTAELRRTLDAWTETFHVTHHDKDACRAKGWTLDYADHVDCSEDVAELVHGLVKQKAFAEVAEAFIAGLAASDAASEAAWYLEFTRWQEDGLCHCITGVATPPEEEDEMIQGLSEIFSEQGLPFDEEEIESFRRTSRESDAVKSAAILELVRSPSLRSAALARVKASDLFDPAATYWIDLRRVLGLED